MMDLLDSTLSDMTAGMRQKKISVSEVCQFYRDRIEKYNPKLNAMICWDQQVMKKAAKMDEKLSRYQDLPLVGIPIVLKDVFCTQGLCTTAGSKMLKNFIPPYSAEVTLRLRKAGAIILGKSNQDEFAMGNSNEDSYFGPVRNPWNIDHVPGGSSGGSAVAVAAGLSPAAVGSDTGGSVRQPASFCNIIGIKPTYGRISRYGMIAYASSLDQAGPMAMNVEDSALLLHILSGRDFKDSTSLEEDVPLWSQQLNADISSMKIGWLNPEEQQEICSQEVMNVIQKVISVLKGKASSVQSVHVPTLKLAVPVYYLVSASEASSNLARYDGVRYGYRYTETQDAKSYLKDFYNQTRSQGFGNEVKRRILMGTFCLSHGYNKQYYNKACCVRRCLRDEFVKLFSQFSLLVAPVSANPAWKIGTTSSGSLESYLNDRFTVAPNLAGLPSLSVPAGFSKEGLPIGVQLIASYFCEQNLLDAALFIQKELQIVGQRPDMSCVH